MSLSKILFVKQVFRYLALEMFPPYLIHKNIKDACGDRQREEGEEEGEEPGRSIHGRMKTLGPEVDVELWKLLLKV